MSPDGEVDPVWDVLLAEGIGKGHSRLEFLLVPILVEDEHSEVLAEVSDGFFELGIVVLKKVIQDGILDIAQPVKRNLGFAVLLGDDEGSDEYFVETELFAEVVDIVALMEQIADGYLAELVVGVVVVAVDREDGEGDVDLPVGEVAFVLFAVLGDFQVDLALAEDVVAEDVHTAEVALLGGVDLVEEIAPQQQEIDLVLSCVFEDFFQPFEGVVFANHVLLFVAQVDVSGYQEADLVLLHA